jgi:predicted  nucleic acid-binding Zn-ribbon protein
MCFFFFLLYFYFCLFSFQAAKTISKLNEKVSELTIEIDSLNTYVSDQMDRNLELKREYDELNITNIANSKEIEKLMIELSAFESCKQVMKEYQADVRRKDEEVDKDNDEHSHLHLKCFEYITSTYFFSFLFSIS